MKVIHLLQGLGLNKAIPSIQRGRPSSHYMIFHRKTSLINSSEDTGVYSPLIPHSPQGKATILYAKKQRTDTAEVTEAAFQQSQHTDGVRKRAKIA